MHRMRMVKIRTERQSMHSMQMKYLSTEPAIPLSVQLRDGDEGLQALTPADETTLVHIQHLDCEGLLVLHISVNNQ